MYETFGEFNSAEEINKTAAGLLQEGDIEGLAKLAEENGLSAYDVEDYVSGALLELTTPMLAALGKIKVERANIDLYEIMNDWVSYIEAKSSEDLEVAAAVRRKGKSLQGCIAKILKWSFDHQYNVPAEIIKEADIKASKVTLGIPGMGAAKKIITEYYMG